MKRRNILAILLCLLMVFAAACAPADPGPGPGPEEPGSGGNGGAEKLVVQVWNTKGGIGQNWLYEAEARFEALNEGREFDSGLVGVDIYTEPRHDPDQSEVVDSEFSVFFIANVDYNAFKRNLLPITDIVTTTSDYDNKTIESKLSEETKAALKAGGNDYYVLPHYQAYDGITYNKTLFDTYGFYFAEDLANAYSNPNQPNYGFVLPSKKEDVSVRTVGPDGVRGTEDDGLPSSIEEFKLLCEYIKNKGIAPFACWDAFNDSYEIRLTNAIWVNLEGYEGAMAQYNFTTGDNTTKIVQSFDGNGKPVSVEKQISKENAWEIYQQESRYWALDFTEYVFKQSNQVMYAKHWNSGSHTDVHVDFLSGESAMMIEGAYWMNEAKDADTFELYPEFLDEDVRFMPLPVQAEGRVTEGNGRTPVALDIGYSYAFINGNVYSKHGEEVAQVAKEFLQFCYSDNELAQFTKNSSVSRDLNYSIGDASDPNSVYSQLSKYAQSAWDVKANGNIVNPISAEPEFIKNPGVFRMYDQYIWQTNTLNGDSKLKAPNIAFNKPESEGWTAQRYFNEIKKDQAWWLGLAR